jgi:hypothetical protein
MPSADDLFNQVVAANNRLEAIKGELLDIKAATDAVKIAVNQVNGTLTSGFDQLVMLGQYNNAALSQNAKQNDTIICILEHISENTCELLNQSVVQTRLQTDMDEGVTGLADMYAVVHADAARESERLQQLQRQVEECCPPARPDAPCKYAPCPAPPPLGDPPKIERDHQDEVAQDKIGQAKTERVEIEQATPEQARVDQPKVDHPKVDQPKSRRPKTAKPKAEVKADEPKGDKPRGRKPTRDKPGRRTKRRR